MRALFFGTPEIAVPSLDALCEVAEVVGVICQPDRPAGRGLELKAPPVKERALALGVLADLHFALHMARAEAYELLARLDEQQVALTVALNVAHTPAERARVLADEAVWHWRRGASELAEGVAAEAVAAIPHAT